MKNLDEILNAVGSTAEFLFKKVTDVNQKSNFGDTPLHIVCQWGDSEAVSTLIKAGANVNAIGEAMMTPLFSAIMAKSVKIVELLIDAGASPLIKDENGRTAIEFAQAIKDESTSNSIKIINILETACIARKE